MGIDDTKVDCLSGPFDKFNDKVGRTYGRLAVKSPCGCCAFGILILMLSAIPFLSELQHKDWLGKPFRGPTNVGKGVSYRTDYEVWTPAMTPVAERFRRVTDDIPRKRRLHMASDAYKKSAKGRSKDQKVLDMATDSMCVDDVEASREDDFFFVLYPREEGQDLCDVDRLKKVWEFEQHIKSEDREGYAYTPDFCPLNDRLDTHNEVLDETSSYSVNIRHKKPCGPYKKSGHEAYHEHPECIIWNTGNYDGCTCKNGPQTCTKDPNFFAGDTLNPGRTDVLTCEVEYNTKCFDAKVYDGNGDLLQDNLVQQKAGLPLTTSGSSYKSAMACALQQPWIPEANPPIQDPAHPGKTLNHTGWSSVSGSQIKRGQWCDKFAVVSPLGLLNVVAYAADVTLDEDIFFSKMLYSYNSSNPLSADGDPVANKTTDVSSLFNSFINEVLTVFAPRIAFSTYLTDAFVKGREIMDRRIEPLRNGSCTEMQCVNSISTFPIRLHPNFTSSDPDVAFAFREANWWSSSCDAEQCVLDLKTFFSTTTTTTTTPSGGGGGGFTCGVTTHDIPCIDMDLDQSQRGEQDPAVCEAITDPDACYQAACQWWPESEMGLQNAPSTMVTGKGDICRPCADDKYNVIYNRVTIGAGCETSPDICQCGMAFSACSNNYWVAKLMCPQACYDAGEAYNPTAISMRMCTTSPSLSGGAASTATGACKDCENFLQGAKTERASLEQSSEAKKRECTDPEAPWNKHPFNKTAAKEAGCNLDLNTIGSGYQIDGCSRMLLMFRLRSTCELNHPSWSRIANGYTPPTKLAREKWVRRTMEEYMDAWVHEDPDELLYPDTSDKAANIYKSLWDAGVGVTMYHPTFLSEEISTLLGQEIGSLGGTFVLMYFFLATAIGPFQPHRWLLSTVVLAQPILAMLMAAGFGQIPIWTMVPGDVDKDDEDDNILSLTILTAFGIHLLLAVVVDYDIILVRAFDRITTKLSFEDRFSVATGYAHRTISVSMLVGIMAFAFGSMVDLPIVQYFCWHSALGMVGLYVCIFTIFLGFMVICEKYLDFSAKHNNSVKEVSAVANEDAEAPSTEAVKPVANAAVSVDSAFHDLVVKDPRDMKFAEALSTPKVAGGILFLEFFLFILFFVGQAAFPLIAEFEGQNYLLPKAKTKLFVEQVNDMGGFPDSVVVWMPGTHMANYHIKEERQYYKSVINDFRANVDGAAQTGLPGLFSWFHELDAHTKGSTMDYLTGTPSAMLSDFHSGCITCPRTFGPSYYETPIEIPGTVTNVAPLFGNGDGGAVNIVRSVGGEGNSIVSFTLFNITTDGVTGLDAYTQRSDFLLPSDPNPSRLLEAGFMVSAIYKRNGPSPGGCMDLLYSLDPSEASERMSQIPTSDSSGVPTVADLITLLNDRTIAPHGFHLKLRRVGDARFAYTSGNLGTYQTCMRNHTNLYGNGKTFTNPQVREDQMEFTAQRDDFWGTPEGKPFFYNMLHSWYEDWYDGSCCDARFDRSTILGKLPGLEQKPAVDMYPKLESQRGRLMWKQTNGEVDGLEATGIIFYIKYNVAESKPRIDTMNKLEEMLEKQREKFPHRWGCHDKTGMADDSFIVARFFLNSDRDDNMVGYLWHHLIWVCGATIISCMLFMHPYYGFATGVFLGMVMFQIQGLMGLFNITLDIVSFAVLVMAMGFAIEYVVHIAHAFLHCEGKGLERTKNALEEMGLTVFSAFLSTAVQQLVLLVAANSKAFELYPVVMLLVIIKSGLSGFLMVPNCLGIIDANPWAAAMLIFPFLAMIVFVTASGGSEEIINGCGA